MYKNLVEYLSAKYVAVWVIFILDVIIVAFSFFLAAFLRFNFDIQSAWNHNLVLHMCVTGVIYGSYFFGLKSYKGVVRHSSLLDLQKIIQASLYAITSLLAIAFVVNNIFHFEGNFLFSRSILIIQFLLASFGLSAFRLIVKSVYGSFLNSHSLLKKRVLIYGAGSSGIITKNTLSQNDSRMVVFGFLDDNPTMSGKRLEGLPVFNTEKFLTTQFIQQHNIDEVVISLADVQLDNKRKVIEYCLEKKISIKEVPPYRKWIGGELSTKQIRPVKIEDLLDRGIINLDSKNIQAEVEGKTILVTGGAGSIGSELVKQCLHYNIKRVIAIDQAESALHQLSIDLLNEPFDYNKFELILGNITDVECITKVFKTYKPEIVLHAAAYKHVPLMEMNPAQAIGNNILGTNCLALLCIEHHVKKFVMVSTDKAVNPTNVMGASKRAAELCVQSLNSLQSKTSFIITRFGNVLGSNGSVIPLFRDQIQKGGPITVTHQDVTRYFMTIPEACNLVLEAGVMGKGGEIFVFDMGEAVKIYDLATKMIHLSGLEVNKDIEIKVTGLRPGEKLFEELLAINENTIPTHHEKILKAQISKVDTAQIKLYLKSFKESINTGNEMELVGILKNFVPEFISKNSRFELLDKSKEAIAS